MNNDAERGRKGITVIEPDTKDWTWVLGRRCPECGVEAAAESPATVAPRLGEAVPRWRQVLQRPDVASRPDPVTWSPLEYAAHVRDVCRVFTQRLGLVLTREDPTFPDWDQDAAAVAADYRTQDPAQVGEQLETAARTLAESFSAVPEDRWGRPGHRGDGAAFTVHTLAQYLLHDVLHHLHDVRG